MRIEDSQSTQRKGQIALENLQFLILLLSTHWILFVVSWNEMREREREKIIKYLTHHKLINELFYLKKKYCVWKALWLIAFGDGDDDDDAVINYVELRQFIFITEI